MPDSHDKAPKPYWQQFDEETKVAVIYAKDGAYHTAAKLLRAVADKAEAHSKWLKEQGF